MTTPNDNLTLWDSVSDTEPSATNKANFDGREQTSINGTYMVRKATEKWGPMGIGWGIEILDERFDQGAPIIDGNGVAICNMVMHTIKLKLWYLQDKKRGEVVHFGHTPYVQKTSYGVKTDMDAPKKSLTDATKKCLSMLGFSADVFLGLFDQPDYVEEQKTREQIAKADNMDDETARVKLEFYDWMKEQARGYGMVPSKGALKTLHATTLKKAIRRAQTLNIAIGEVEKRLTGAYQQRMQELNPDIATVCEECGDYQEKGKAGDECKECGGKVSPAEASTGDNSKLVTGVQSND